MSEEKVTRRGYAKYAAAGIVVVAVAGAGAYYATRPSAGPGGGGTPQAGKYSWEERTGDYYNPIEATELNVWLDFAQFVTPTLEEPFTNETGIQFSVNPYMDEMDMFARMKAGGSGADGLHLHLVTAPDDPSRKGVWREQLEEGNPLLEPLDMGVMSNYGEFVGGRNYWESTNKWDGKVYAIPFQLFTDQVAYNTEEVDVDDASTIEVLWNPKFANRIGTVDYAIESVAIAGIYTGAEMPWNQTEAELSRSKNALLEQKKIVRAYWASPGDLENLFASKEVVVSWTWWACINNLYQEGFPVTWTEQEEGVIVGACQHACYIESAHKYETMQWLNYLLSEEYGVRHYQETGYRTGSALTYRRKDVFTDEVLELLGINKMEQTLGKGAYWSTPNLLDKYIEVWSEVMAA